MPGFGIRGLGFVMMLAALGGACGSSSSSTAPSNGGGGGGGPVATTTITISNNAVSPKNITVARGAQVTFVNNDSRNHNMTSDPHPEHTDCPEVNQVGFLVPGQSRQSGNLVTPRTCGFHDHDNFSVTSLQGSITIQ
jgi:plastocyanin